MTPESRRVFLIYCHAEIVERVRERSQFQIVVEPEDELT